MDGLALHAEVRPSGEDRGKRGRTCRTNLLVHIPKYMP